MLKLISKVFSGNVTNCGRKVFIRLMWTQRITALNIQTKSAYIRRLHSVQEQKNSDNSIMPRPNVVTSEDAYESIRLQKIKQALQQHMKKIQEEGSVKAQKEDEFEIGRRHLANMMGEDPNTFTQSDINRAIEYLMPSGLFEPKARPVMKPPGEIDPVKEGHEVDETVRPVNTFFYTGKGGLFSIHYEISRHFQELNEFEDKMLSKGTANPPPETKIFLGDSEWITLPALKTMLRDNRLEQDSLNYLIESLERLVEHPYSFRIKDFIMTYRTPKTGFGSNVDIPPLTVGEDGIPYAEAQGRRRWTRAHVTVRGKGSGQVNINGMDISYFKQKQDREQLLFPLKFSGLLNQVDFEAQLTGMGGTTAEAGAIRHGLSLALCSFVNSETVEEMRLAGLINRDVRKRERKKPGQKGARAKYKWRKR